MGKLQPPLALPSPPSASVLLLQQLRAAFLLLAVVSLLLVQALVVSLLVAQALVSLCLGAKRQPPLQCSELQLSPPQP